MYVTGKKGFPQICQKFGPAFCRDTLLGVSTKTSVTFVCLLSLSHIAKAYGKGATGSSFFHTFFPDASSLTLQNESFYSAEAAPSGTSCLLSLSPVFMCLAYQQPC